MVEDAVARHLWVDRSLMPRWDTTLLLAHERWGQLSQRTGKLDSAIWLALASGNGDSPRRYRMAEVTTMRGKEMTMVCRQRRLTNKIADATYTETLGVCRQRGARHGRRVSHWWFVDKSSTALLSLPQLNRPFRLRLLAQCDKHPRFK